MFDVIIVGGGPAGLSAGLMLGRCRRRVLLCDRGQPRNRRSKALHGFLTRDGIPPGEFNALGREELATYGLDCRPIGVADAVRENAGFIVRLDNGRTERARFLLLATGVVDELPAVDGIEACYGRSVFHCPYCDGWERRDRQLAALGTGSGASKLALSLRTWSDHVLLCTNGARIDRRVRRRMTDNGVVIRTEPIASLEHSDGLLARIVFAQGEPAACDAIFFSTGQHQQDALAVRLGCTFTSKGTVQTGTLCGTNVPGVFVAGDASRDAQFVAVAVAEGIKAAVAINQALQKEDLA